MTRMLPSNAVARRRRSPIIRLTHRSTRWRATLVCDGPYEQPRSTAPSIQHEIVLLRRVEPIRPVAHGPQQVFDVDRLDPGLRPVVELHDDVRDSCEVVRGDAFEHLHDV